MKLRGKIKKYLTLPILGALMLFPTSGCLNGSIAEGIATLASSTGGSGTSLDDLTDFEIYVDPVALFYKQEELFTAATGYYAVAANTAPTTDTKVKMIFHLENAIKNELGASVAAQVLAAIPSSTTLQTIRVTINFNDLYTWTFDLGDAVTNSRWQTLMVIDAEGGNRFVQTATPLFNVQEEATAIENENGIYLFGGFYDGSEVDWVSFIPDGSGTVYSSEDSGGAYLLSSLTQDDGYPVVIPTTSDIYTDINTAWPLVGSKMSAAVKEHFIIVHAKDNSLSGGGADANEYDNGDVDGMYAYVYDDAEAKIYQYFLCSSSYNAGGVSSYRCNRAAVYDEIFDEGAPTYQGLNGAVSVQINGSATSEGLWDLTTPGFGPASAPGVAGTAYVSGDPDIDDGTTVFSIIF